MGGRSPPTVDDTSRTQSRPSPAVRLRRTSTTALRNWPARKPSRLATTIRGTKPRTDVQAAWWGQSGAGGAASTTRKVTDMSAATANPVTMARRARAKPYTSAKTSPSTYVRGNRKAPPSVMNGPNWISFVAPTFEMRSSPTNQARTRS